MKKIFLIIFCLYAYLYAVSFPFTPSNYARKHYSEKPMVIIVPSYNNAQWYLNNLQSILMQEYTNVRIIYIVDGCGTEQYDGTAELVENYIEKNNNKFEITLIKNKDKKGALYNIYHAVQSCYDHEIVVLLDGDDWFYHNQVLSTLNDIYHNKKIWLTHGTFIEYPRGDNYWSVPLDPNVVSQHLYRQYRCPSHCRTFYASLFKKIKVEDLLMGDQFYPMTWDQAILFPMLEMAGEHHAFVSDPIYVYNMANSINDNKVDPLLQRNLERVIRSKQPYRRLGSLH